MTEKRINNTGSLFFFCMGGVPFLWLSMLFTIQFREVKLEIPYIGQVVKDWEMSPFVEIKVENNGCLSGWDPVFSKEWAGFE